jgi:hypothetical protein
VTFPSHGGVDIRYWGVNGTLLHEAGKGPGKPITLVCLVAVEVTSLKANRDGADTRECG